MTSFGYFFIRAKSKNENFQGLEMFRGSWIKIKYLLSGDVLGAIVSCLVKFGFSNVTLVRIRCFLSQLENWHRFRFGRKQIARAGAKECREL